MDPLTALALASAGGRLAGGLLGGKRERGYEMSPAERMLYDTLLKQYEGQVPGSVTAPFVQRRKDIKQSFRRQAGASGLEHAIGKRQADIPMAEAIKGYKGMLSAQMASLMRGTGTQWTQEPFETGGMAGDIGFALAMAGAGKPGAVGSGGGGSYGGGIPLEHLFGHRSRNVQMPRGY